MVVHRVGGDGGPRREHLRASRRGDDDGGALCPDEYGRTPRTRQWAEHGLPARLSEYRHREG